MKFNKIFEIVFMPFLQIIDVLIANFIQQARETIPKIWHKHVTMRDTCMCSAIFDNTGETCVSRFSITYSHSRSRVHAYSWMTHISRCDKYAHVRA